MGIDYDPMLAKLIVHAEHASGGGRGAALALSQVRIAGVGNNVMFLRRLAASKTFASGLLDIGFIERERELRCGAQRAPDARAARSRRRCGSLGVERPRRWPRPGTAAMAGGSMASCAGSWGSNWVGLWWWR